MLFARKNECLNFLRMASRVDAVVSRVQMASSMRTLATQMKHVVTNMERSMKSMDLEAIGKVMDGFEHSFKNLDVQSSYMSTAMDSTTMHAVPTNQVQSLIQEVADAHGLKIEQEFSEAVGLTTSSTTLRAGALAAESKSEADTLNERLSRLRNEM